MLLPTAIEASRGFWAAEAGQFLGGQAPNLQDMHPVIEPPVYTLPSGAFALPLSVQRLRQLSSTAYLQQFLPPQPGDLHAWAEDATLCACALELWSAIVDLSASRPALEALAGSGADLRLRGVDTQLEVGLRGVHAARREVEPAHHH